MSNKIAGLVDFPVSDVKIYRPEISVRGYAFTEDGDDLDVRVFVDQQQVETARWGLPRIDVYRKYNIEPAYLSGFVVRCPIPGFTMGIIRQEHNFTASVESGKNGEEVILGPIRFYSGRKDDDDEPVTKFIFPAGAPGSYRKFGQEHLESLITDGGLRPFHDVLEIGCGMGRTAVKLAGYLRMNSKYCMEP